MPILREVAVCGGEIGPCGTCSKGVGAAIITFFRSIKQSRKKRDMTSATSISPADFLPRFGLTEFRAGQREVIESVFAGHDCLCIMPTGGGKSLCYQLPSVARPE